MLSKFIVEFYGMLVEIFLWILMVIGLVAGWQAGGFFGAIGGLIISFISMTILIGAFLILDDIRNNLKAINQK